MVSKLSKTGNIKDRSQGWLSRVVSFLFLSVWVVFFFFFLVQTKTFRSVLPFTKMGEKTREASVEGQILLLLTASKILPSKLPSGQLDRRVSSSEERSCLGR